MPDPSLEGWRGAGAHTLWEPLGPGQIAQERKLPINILELCAIQYTLNSFWDIVQGKSVLIQMGNVSAMFYINRQGDTGSRLLSTEVWLWALECSIHLWAIHIAGKHSLLANTLSRVCTSNKDWALTAQYILPIFGVILWWVFFPHGTISRLIIFALLWALIPCPWEMPSTSCGRALSYLFSPSHCLQRW